MLAGAGVDGAVGSGVNATSPPSTSAATAIPATRPATIDRRALIRAGAYQYERPTAVRRDRCYDAAPMAILDRFRTRIVPAVLTALGVVLLAGGLLTYTNPVTADPIETPTATPSPVAAVATPSPLISLPPITSSAVPSASAAIPADRVTTRVRVAALKIDLPVITQPNGGSRPATSR